jgi:hypothetical protein
MPGGSSGAIRAGNAFVEFTLKDGALRKGLAALEKRFKSIGSTLNKIGSAMTAAGAAITSAFSAAASVFANVGSELADVSARTGLSVQALGELGYAAKQSGGSLEAVEKGARGMARLLFDAANESKTAEETLSALGLTLADLKGLKPEDQFTLIGERIADIEDPTTKAALAMKAFGKSGVELLPMLGTLGDMRAEARRLGLVMSGDDAAAADRLGDAMDAAWMQFSRIVQTIGSAVAGPLADFLEASQAILRAAIDWASENKALVQTIFFTGAAVTVAGTAVVALGVGFQVLAVAAAGFSAAIGAVGTVLTAILSPVGLVIAGVVGLATQFDGLVDHAWAAISPIMQWFGELGGIVAQSVSAMAGALAAGNLEAAGKVLWSGLNLLWVQGTAGLSDLWAQFMGGLAKTWATGWAVLMQGGNVVWGNLERGWSHVVDFFVTSFERAVGNLKILINEVWGFFQKAWAFITGASQSEIDRLNAEILGANAIINADFQAKVAARQATGEREREQSRQLQSGVLEVIGTELEAKISGITKGTAEAVAKAQAGLNDARAAWKDATTAAQAVAQSAQDAKAKAAAEAADKGVATASDLTPGKLTSSGSFNALAAFLTGQGGDTDAKILNVNQQQLLSLQKIERKVGGALTATA